MIKENSLVLTLPIFKSFKLSFRFFWILVIAATLALLVACIFQLNAYTEEFYLIQDYEAKIVQLNQENKILEINFTQANSLKNIGDYLQSQVFEKAEKVEYIQLLEGTALAK